MLRDPHEEYTLPVGVGASAATALRSDELSLDVNGDGSRSGAGEHEGWLSAAIDSLPRAILLLPPAERRLVVGRYYEERPLDELARELRLSPDRATSLLGDALRTLRAKIGV